MAKWDDPIGQIKAGLEEPRNPATELALRGIKWIPVIGGTIRKALDSIKGQQKETRLQFFQTAIIEQLEAQETSIDEIIRRLEQPEFNRLASVAIERIFFGANERKVRRFAAVINNAATNDRTEQQFEDAASFIRALDELSEDDIKVLKHLHNHQKHRVNEQHAMPYSEFFRNNEMTGMLMDARNLGMQIDEFYSRLNRLSGYGLALPLDKSHGQSPGADDFAFRMTLLGKRLIDMLVKAGESMDVTKRR